MLLRPAHEAGKRASLTSNNLPYYNIAWRFAQRNQKPRRNPGL